MATYGRINRVTNPSIETNTSGWGVMSAAVLTRDNTHVWVGAWALKVDPSATSGSGTYISPSLAGIIAGAGAHLITAQVRLWIPSGQAVDLLRLDVGYSDTSQLIGTAYTANGTNNWQLFSFPPIATDPSKTVSTITMFARRLGTNLFSYWLDGADIRIDEPEIEDYIDGSLGTYYGWTGTAHASTSYYYAPITGNVSTTSRLQPLNPDGVWHSGGGSFEASITRPADLAPTILPLNGVNVAWKVSGQSTLSAEIWTDTLLETFGSIDLRAYWLRWQHPTLGIWTGEITECEADLSTGTTELGATDFSNLLDSRRIAKVYDVQSATAGALFKRVIVDAQREADGYSWIRTINADETGDPLKWQARGGTVLDAIQNLESNSQEEWWVDENRVAWWARRRGSNKTGSVQLVEGVHLVAGRYSVALRPLVNDLRVLPADEQYAVSQSFALDDDVSIKRFGRRQDQLTYTVGVTKATLLPVATRDLARLTKLGDTIQFDLADVALNEQISAFAAIRDGDSILLLLPSLNRAMQVRVLARSYDSESDLLRISADVEG